VLVAIVVLAELVVLQAQDQTAVTVAAVAVLLTLVKVMAVVAQEYLDQVSVVVQAGHSMDLLVV
jgi:hypothetical protein